jgi:hypothetical protein
MRQLRRRSLLVGTAAAVADVQHARVILVRHGETNYNAEGRIQGRLESVLTAKGQGHAAALGEWLADNEPSSSTRARAFRVSADAHTADARWLYLWPCTPGRTVEFWGNGYGCLTRRITGALTISLGTRGDKLLSAPRSRGLRANTQALRCAPTTLTAATTLRHDFHGSHTPVRCERG